jgi:hypothetical protein
MYLTDDHHTMTAGSWTTQDLSQSPAEPAPSDQRIVLFKKRGAPPRRVRIRRGGLGPTLQPGCVAHG